MKQKINKLDSNIF